MVKMESILVKRLEGAERGLQEFGLWGLKREFARGAWKVCLGPGDKGGHRRCASLWARMGC